MTFGRKVVAPSKDPAPKTARRAKSDDVAPPEPELDLNQATLAIDDGLLMVLGPEGDPVPPGAVAALAASQPETPLAFDDGTRVPAGRVANVLAAQTGGRLGPAGDEADAWLKTMLGIGPAPATAGGEELEAERDQLEITLFGSELVISTAAGSSFVITPVRPGGSKPAVAQLALGDGTPVGLEDVVGRLRRTAGLDADEAGDVAELAVPGCGFARDGEALVLTTARGETFVFTEADGGTEGRVALYTPDGESAPFARLADALGLGDGAPDPRAGAVADHDSQAPVDASVQVETGAARDDHARRTASAARADDEPGDLGPAAPPEAEDAGKRPQAPQDRGQADVVVEPTTELGDEGADRREVSEAHSDQPMLGEAAPVPPDTRPATANEGGAEGGKDKAGDAPVNPPQRVTIPLACRLGPDDPSNVTAILIAGVPAGAVLSAGSDNGDGSWVVPPDQLEALAITLPGDALGPLTLEARLVTVDDRDGAMSTVARDVVISAEAGGGSAPTFEPGAGLRLDLDAMVREAAAGRPVSAVVVGGLPADAKLSAGLFDDELRSWVVRPGELEELRLSAGAFASAPLELRVTVVTMDPSAGKPSAVTRSVEVGPAPTPTVDPAADRTAQRVGGAGFFRPLYNRRR